MNSRVVADSGILLASPLEDEPLQLYAQSLLRFWREHEYEIAAPTLFRYDSQYLAVAERLNCEFWTANERLYNALRQDVTWVKWLGNFAPPQ